MIQADGGGGIIHTVPRDKSSQRGELMRHPGGLWDGGKAFI